MGRYLREWGAEVVFLQETLMEHDDSRLWRALGWGEGGAHMVLEAVGRSGGDRLGMEGQCIRENGGMAGATCGGGSTFQASGWMVLGGGISLWPSDLSTPDRAMGGY